MRLRIKRRLITSKVKKRKLQERALREVGGVEGVREEFITEVLIEAQENGVLEAEMEEGENGLSLKKTQGVSGGRE